MHRTGGCNVNDGRRVTTTTPRGRVFQLRRRFVDARRDPPTRLPKHDWDPARGGQEFFEKTTVWGKAEEIATVFIAIPSPPPTPHVKLPSYPDGRTAKFRTRVLPSGCIRQSSSWLWCRAVRRRSRFRPSTGSPAATT